MSLCVFVLLLTVIPVWLSLFMPASQSVDLSAMLLDRLPAGCGGRSQSYPMLPGTLLLGP